MNTSDVKRVLEGALLCASKPLTVSELRQVFSDDVEVSADTVRALLETLRQEWKGRSVELATLASGWRFQSAPDVARFVMRLYPEKTPKYSRAVMETLAIIAYRQPVTRGDIEEIRGVTVSSQIIRTLEERGWIEQVGVKDVPGRPALFATTRQFLDDVGLRSLTELPALDADESPDAAVAAPIFADRLQAPAELAEVGQPSEAQPGTFTAPQQNGPEQSGPQPQDEEAPPGEEAAVAGEEPAVADEEAAVAQPSVAEAEPATEVTGQALAAEPAGDDGAEPTSQSFPAPGAARTA